MTPLEKQHSPSSDQERSEIAEHLRQLFQAKLPMQIDRSLNLKSKVWPLLPQEPFAMASSECRGLYISGHDFACVLACQTLAEAIAKYAVVRNNLAAESQLDQKDVNLKKLVGMLHSEKNRVISSAVRLAFLELNKLRNEFHHFNASVHEKVSDCGSCALSCLSQLWIIQSDLFHCEVAADGCCVPTNRQYWDFKPDGTMPIFVQESMP